MNRPSAPRATNAPSAWRERDGRAMGDLLEEQCAERVLLYCGADGRGGPSPEMGTAAAPQCRAALRALRLPVTQAFFRRATPTKPRKDRKRSCRERVGSSVVRG